MTRSVPAVPPPSAHVQRGKSGTCALAVCRPPCPKAEALVVPPGASALQGGFATKCKSLRRIPQRITQLLSRTQHLRMQSAGQSQFRTDDPKVFRRQFGPNAHRIRHLLGQLKHIQNRPAKLQKPALFHGGPYAPARAAFKRDGTRPSDSNSELGPLNCMVVTLDSKIIHTNISGII